MKQKMISILALVAMLSSCILGGISVLADGYTPDITTAIIADADDTSRTVCESYTAELDGTTVDIDMTGLAYHKNGAGDMGYWTGFAVVAPDGATKVTYTFGETTATIPAEDIDQLGTAGIAFYTDAADPKTEVTLQWLDADELAVTEEVTLTMDLTDVEYYGAGEVIEAIVADKDDSEAVVYDNYEIDTAVEGVVAISMTGLKKHTNGEDVEGYWTGFAVAAPEGAEKVKYTFGETTDGIAPVEDIDQLGTMGVAFYTDAGKATPNTEATFQWLNAEEEVLSAPFTYTMDLSNVELGYGAYTPEITTAIIADAANTDREVHGDYTAVLDGTTVDIDMTGLVYHENGEGDMGYWTGFAVEAPVGATKVKYTFGETTDGIAPVEDIDQLGTMGVAFYTDAADPKTEVTLQWLDDNESAVTEAVSFTMDFSGVEYIAIEAADVSVAKITDDAVVTKDVTTEEDGTIVVKLTAADLAKHANVHGTDGYWAGFALAAPTADAQMKVAFEVTSEAAEAAFAVAGLTELEADVDEENNPGVAFYANAGASTPKTVAMLQWFDENGYQITAPVKFVIDLSGITLETDYVLNVSAAKITDDAEVTVDTTTEEDGTIAVKVTAADLAKHANVHGTDGYWAGFAVTAPAADAQMKVAFDTAENIDAAWASALLTNVLEADVDADNNPGVAFYADAAAAAPKTVAKLQWFDAEGLAHSNVMTFVIDLTDVTYEDAIDIVAEDVVKTVLYNNADGSTPYSAYNVVAADEEGTIKVDVSNNSLKSHENAYGVLGHWTGFAVIAPAEAVNMKYAFDTAANIDWNSAIYCPVEANVDGESNAGVAFYANVSDAEPKTVAMLQWFDAEGNPISNIKTFEMDLSAVAKYAPASSGGGSVSSYLNVAFETNGGSKIASARVKKGESVEKPADPTKEGFTFAGWYTDKELTSAYDFSSTVKNSFTLYAKWVEGEGSAEDAPFGFTDISKDAWYYDVVAAAIEKGLMNGISETEFAPNASLTRGMFVTILYRLVGEVAVEGENIFADVPADQYYTNAVIWATSNGIVNGITEEMFAPNSNITREQMATIICRFVEYAEVEIEAGGDVIYTDSADISDYAKDAVKVTKWLGILEGNADGSFAPQRNATRAEAAAAFVRLLNVIG